MELRARIAQRYAWPLVFCIGVGILRNHCDNLMNKLTRRDRAGQLSLWKRLVSRENRL